MAEIKKTKVGNTGKNEEIKEPAKASAIEPAEKPAETVKAAVKVQEEAPAAPAAQMEPCLLYTSYSTDLLSAYMKMESVEFYAQLLYLSLIHI